jgi:hypothetical protein
LLAGLFGSAFVPSALAVRSGASETTPVARYTTVTINTGEEAGIISNEGYYDAKGAEKHATKWGTFSDWSDDAAADNGAYFDIQLFYGGASGVGATAKQVEAADFKVESSNSKIKVAILDSTADNCADMDSETTGGDDEALDYFGQTDTVADMADVDGIYTFCVAADKSTTAAAGTITVKARAADSTGDYVTVKTLPFQVLGEVATLTASITDGYKYIANDNFGLDDWITITGKDSAGNILNGGNGDITQDWGLWESIDNWEDNPENWAEDQINFLDEEGGQGVDADYGDYSGDGSYSFASQLYAVNSDVCLSNDDTESKGDEGKSYTVKFETLGGDVVSNGITFTCTDVYAKVTKITPEATSGDMLYEEAAPGDGDLSLTATVVDSANRPMGDGAIIGEEDDLSCDDFEWDTFDGEVIDGDTDLDADGDYSGDVVGGECEVTSLTPDMGRMGRFSYTLTALLPDLGDDEADSVDFKLAYTAGGTEDVTISVKRNAAKTVATFTVDAGEDNAFESVYFQVEKASGAVVEMRRRANVDGVAKLVLARRNTVVYVFAYVGIAETDSVKARFR